MTRSLTRFPIASRFLAVTLALVAVAALSVHAAASTSHQDVVDANAHVEALLAKVDDERNQLDELQTLLDRKTTELFVAMGQYDAITAQLLTTQHALAQAKLDYFNTMHQLNERAVAAYMGGPGQDISFLVGASSLGDLSDRLEYMDAVAQSDADLAQTVQNTKNRLSTQQANLEKLQAKQRDVVAKTKAAQEFVRQKFAEQQTLLSQIRSDLAEAERYKKKVAAEWQAALKAAQSQGYGGSHPSVPLPPGYEHVLERCPVNGPRSFGDGFGAPRYAGGYHLHKGVDIMSGYGTEIVAPFDGYARTDYNSLGGNVVFVSGQYGTVYNAHLQEFAAKSNGPVQAGDVIGYVGDTGDATGIPHDHFEFHPNVMPSSWPVSAYGYSIIEDAVNPYPLLVAACG